VAAFAFILVRESMLNYAAGTEGSEGTRPAAMEGHVRLIACFKNSTATSTIASLQPLVSSPTVLRLGLLYY
jgi:hypothetical protein